MNYIFTIKEQNFLPHLSCELSLTLRKGQGLILMGENGVGKSTLLRKMRDYWAPKHPLSFMSQKPLDFFYDRKLGHFRRILLSSRDQDIDLYAFHRLWDVFNLAYKEERQISALSGGELQCLKLVCGLSAKAEIFLMDEPFQYLDAEKSKLLVESLGELILQGKTPVMVEHSLPSGLEDYRVQEFKNETGQLVKGRSWTT